MITKRKRNLVREEQQNLMDVCMGRDTCRGMYHLNAFYLLSDHVLRPKPNQNTQYIPLRIRTKIIIIKFILIKTKIHFKKDLIHLSKHENKKYILFFIYYYFYVT